MLLRHRRNLLVAGLLAFSLAAGLIARLHFRLNHPGEAKAQSTALVGHQFPVRALAFRSDGATLTSAAFDTLGSPTGVEVVVWDVGTGQVLTKSIQYQNPVSSLALARGGQHLVATLDRTLLLWDVARWSERSLEGPRSLAAALAYSGDGTRLATANQDATVTLWDVPRGRPMVCCTGHHGSVFSLAFVSDATLLASGGIDNTVRLWDVATGQQRGLLPGHTGWVLALAFSPDGQTLASGDFHGAVKLWDVTTLQERATLETFGHWVTAVTFAPDGGMLAVAVDDAVQLWDVQTGCLVAHRTGHQAPLKCLAFSPDGTRLASGGDDRTVRLWDVGRYRTPRP
jgi:WD40 repeat protein